MGIRLIKSRTRKIGPVDAKLMLEHVDQRWQRDKVMKHVAHLAQLIASRDFLTGHFVEAHVLSDNTTRNANGMHTANAIVMADGPSIVALCELYECDTNEDYVKLFLSYDTENRKRTHKDCAAVFIMGHRAELPAGLTALMLNEFRVAMELAEQYAAGFTGSHSRAMVSHKSRHNRLETVLEFLPALHFVLELDSRKVKKALIHRAPVMASMINSFYADEQKARQFWGQIVSGFWENCAFGAIGHPPYVCHHWLLSHAINQKDKKSDNQTKEIVSRLEMYRGCQRCWHAFVRGDSIQAVRYQINQKAKPETVAKLMAG